jgi:ankyrin repeat protein
MKKNLVLSLALLSVVVLSTSIKGQEVSDDQINNLITRTLENDDQAAYDQLATIAKAEPYKGPSDLGSRLGRMEAARFNISTKNIVGAAQINSLPAVKILIIRGVDVNKRDANGKTALDYAKENNNQDMIAALTAAGAK